MPKISPPRLCCQKLAQCAQHLTALQNPAIAGQLFALIQQECFLIKQHGAEHVKFDPQAQTCYLQVNPAAETIVSEAGMTIAVHDRTQYQTLADINGILAQNAQAQQISQHQLVLLSQLRTKERKFGAVLAESSLSDIARVGETLDQTNHLQSHPKLSKTQQFDGISDRKANPLPAENPEAQQKAAELTMQPRPGVHLEIGQKKKFDPRPAMP